MSKPGQCRQVGGLSLSSSAPVEGGGIYVFKLADALARSPGQLKVDFDEARRIAKDIAERYLRGEFMHEEVVGKVGPAEFRPYRDTGEYEEGTINFNLWFAGIALTVPAAKRYVECCGLQGAPRVLAEWFCERKAATAEETAGTSASVQRGLKEISKPQLLKYIEVVKVKGGPIPTQASLHSEVKAAFPDFLGVPFGRAVRSS
jgi:hypothetical protein